jgi:hypothetical protein
LNVSTLPPLPPPPPQPSSSMMTSPSKDCTPLSSPFNASPSMSISQKELVCVVV